MPTNQSIRRRSAFLFDGLESRALLSGSGLTGTYYDEADFTQEVVTRVDASVDFNWGAGAPGGGVGPDTFSVRWKGSITAGHSESYTFLVTADDGVRLWIDGKLVIDAWSGASNQTRTGTVAMQANKAVGILLEYRDVSGDAHVSLKWASASQTGNIAQTVPTSALRPTVMSGTPLKVMLIGDSVTEGETNHASYRFWLDRMLTSAGYNFDFVGSRNSAHNGAPLYQWFDGDHQSRWGATLDEVSNYTTAYMDVAIIHIGHNDIRGGQSPVSMGNEVAAYIDKLRSINPNVKVILAKPIYNTSLGYISEMDNYANVQIPSVAAAKSTSQSPVIVVDQRTGFDPNSQTYDAVHPNESGEKQLADRFYSAIGQLVGSAVIHHPVTPEEPKPVPNSGRISGYVFNDANKNHARDGNEKGLANRQIYLDFNNNGVRDANEPQRVTGADGSYNFTGLPIGSYRVRHHVLSALAGTTPVDHQIIVKVQGVTVLSTASHDFGVVAVPPPSTTVGKIGGLAFHDRNGNGIWDTGEERMRNRYVYIDSNNNGIFDKNERFAVTGADGMYVFNNLPAGNYNIRAVVGPMIRSTYPSPSLHVVNLAAGELTWIRHFGFAMN